MAVVSALAVSYGGHIFVRLPFSWQRRGDQGTACMEVSVSVGAAAWFDPSSIGVDARGEQRRLQGAPFGHGDDASVVWQGAVSSRAHVLAGLGGVCAAVRPEI